MAAKMKPLRVILIDPIVPGGLITEAQFENAPDYRWYNDWIGSDIFTCLNLTVKDKLQNSMFLDDEGLLKPHLRGYRFQLPSLFGSTSQTFAGRAVITACDDEGNTISTNYTLDEVKAMVKFVQRF